MSIACVIVAASLNDRFPTQFPFVVHVDAQPHAYVHAAVLLSASLHQHMTAALHSCVHASCCCLHV